MSTKKKILFIANPISGSGHKIDFHNAISQNLDTSRFDWSLYYTTARGDATRRAQEASNGTYHAVIAIGGDGTINEVAQGLVYTDTCMGIIPNGSGNGLSKHLRISNDIPAAITQLNHATPQLIDTGWFNDQLFLNVAGIGFDAQVAHAFDTFGKRGLFSYILLSIKEFGQFSPSTCKIKVDGKKLKAKAFILTIANGSQYGNNAYIAPKAQVTDGYLDLVVIEPLRFWQWITFPIQLFGKSLDTTSRYRFAKGKKITIKSKYTKAQLDGEPIQAADKNHIEIKPKSLKMLIP
ncbi:hypothetical protein BFP72_14495 [Reichenbachiella sp. 5M10]|uniref:diacylglycerol/lipid kinase family protein n=1 Tax=Reichenbachiella sp. 5M10 TaxID=1889772 RepID=UPI000C14D3E5|nr:diacylglycerol kinase family protein [Reichenbachiella sp. 5M10]PIB36522.1 hypothetical protein BFP72_14495 [Reichenbachiella sp. 5M10]